MITLVLALIACFLVYRLLCIRYVCLCIEMRECLLTSSHHLSVVAFSFAGQHDVTYKDVFGGKGSFAAQVDHQVKAALQAHRARTASGKLFWVSTAAQNPWPTVGSTSVERQMVAEHLVQAVGTGLWDGLLDFMQLTTGRMSGASPVAASSASASTAAAFSSIASCAAAVFPRPALLASAKSSLRMGLIWSTHSLVH